MIKKLNFILGSVVLMFIMLILVWYFKNGKTTFILYRAVQNVNKASSFELETTMDIEGDVEFFAKKEFDSTVLINTKVVKRPHLQVRQDYKVQALRMTPNVFTQYLIEDDQDYRLYSKNPNPFSEKWRRGTITKREVKQRSGLELLGMLMMANDEIEIKRISDDRVDGKEVTEIELILYDEDTKKIIRSVLSSISEETLSKELVDSINKTLDHEVLNVFVYIDKETDYIYKIEFDITRIMARLLEDDNIKLNIVSLDIMKYISSQMLDLNSFHVVIKVKNYNNTDFAVPNFR